MFLSYLVCLTILLVVLCIYVALQPDEFRVTRSAVMTSPAQDIFGLVNDFQKWASWSPWAKMDLTAKNTFGGAPSGVGSTFAWEGNKKVGAGRMEITESKPFQHIKIRLDFEKPFKATNMAEYTFTPQGSQTTVTWTTYGPTTFMSKAMGLILNCEKMVGGQFEQGLASMKAIVEQKKA